MFQRSYVQEQQEIRRIRKETDEAKACHQSQPTSKSSGKNSCHKEVNEIS